MSPRDIGMLAEFRRVAWSLPIKQEFVPFKQCKVTFKDIKVRRNAWYFQQNAKKKVKFDVQGEGGRWATKLDRNEIIMGYVSSKNVELYPEREFLPV